MARVGGAPRGKAHGRYKHGLYTTEAIEARRALRELLRESRDARGTYERRDVDCTVSH